VDCGVPFHKECLARHCADDLAAAERDRDAARERIAVVEVGHARIARHRDLLVDALRAAAPGMAEKIAEQMRQEQS
jgi:hypothetical protein